jgi:hypothetical protein
MRAPTITRNPGEREIKMDGPAAEPITNYEGGYAEKIQTLPVSADGVNRRNEWHDNTVKASKKTLPRTMENEFQNALGGKP